MQVVNKSSYITTIYSAIVVNKDTSLDPDNKNRVQIYIPSVNYEYADHWKEYMNDNNKKDSIYFSTFPWAVTLNDNLQNGDEVYGSYIDGDGQQYIVLGLNGGKSTAKNNSEGIGGNVNITDLLGLAMCIVMHNEIGVSISAWADGTISDEHYATVTLHDGGERNKTTGQWIKQGCWAIGLIQWNGVRAYDTVYKIAEKDGNWESYFTNDSDLKSSIKRSLSAKSTSGQRTLFSLDSGYNPEKGGATYNAISNLISSDIGKQVQNELAQEDTANTINMLIDEGCNNKAILIYMADFYNQYGSGFSNTTAKCVEACNQSGTIIDQLDWLIENQLKPNFKSSFPAYDNNGNLIVGSGKYKNRRDTTYDYIVDLYNNGKLNNNNLVDESSESGSVINGTGQYCMPYEGTAIVTATWGEGGYHRSGNYHTGIDFGVSSGTPLYACTTGTIKHLGSYGLGIAIMADDDNMIIYGHCSSRVAENGERVNKGDLIAYSGYTGHVEPPRTIRSSFAF